MALYSIFYASIRKATQERLSLGILLFDDQNIYFKTSDKKLAGLKNFLPKEDYSIIQQSFDAIKGQVLAYSELMSWKDYTFHNIKDKAFSIDYINYLSRYKNNLITYSEPKSINIEATPENFLKLFESLVGPEVHPAEKVYKPSTFERLESQFQGNLANYFNTHFTLTSQQVPNLLAPVKIDLIGRNGQDVLVRTVDTSSGPEKISNEVSSFYMLVDTYRKNNMPMQDFIIAEEPMRKNKKQHEIWREIKESGSFNYLDISEGEKLKEYAIQHHVVPKMIITNPDDDHIDEFPF